MILLTFLKNIKTIVYVGISTVNYTLCKAIGCAFAIYSHYSQRWVEVDKVNIMYDLEVYGYTITIWVGSTYIV